MAMLVALFAGEDSVGAGGAVPGEVTEFSFLLHPFQKKTIPDKSATIIRRLRFIVGSCYVCDGRCCESPFLISPHHDFVKRPLFERVGIYRFFSFWVVTLPIRLMLGQSGHPILP
jgi:hypothetical protein